MCIFCVCVNPCSINLNETHCCSFYNIKSDCFLTIDRHNNTWIKVLIIDHISFCTLSLYCVCVFSCYCCCRLKTDSYISRIGWLFCEMETFSNYSDVVWLHWVYCEFRLSIVGWWGFFFIPLLLQRLLMNSFYFIFSSIDWYCRKNSTVDVSNESSWCAVFRWWWLTMIEHQPKQESEWRKNKMIVKPNQTIFYWK